MEPIWERRGRSAFVESGREGLGFMVPNGERVSELERRLALTCESFPCKNEDFALPSEKRTAKGSVILRESKALPFERFTNFVGQSVICKGEFVTGKPYIPPADSAEQVPSPVPSFLGKSEPPLRGGGFKVYAITRIEGK